MKVILDMVGWRKVEEVPDYTVQTGRIDVGFYPPVSTFVETLAGKAVTEEQGIPYALFEFTGKYHKKMPVFSLCP